MRDGYNKWIQHTKKQDEHLLLVATRKTHIARRVYTNISDEVVAHHSTIISLCIYTSTCIVPIYQTINTKIQNYHISLYRYMHYRQMHTYTSNILKVHLCSCTTKTIIHLLWILYLKLSFTLTIAFIVTNAINLIGPKSSISTMCFQTTCISFMSNNATCHLLQLATHLDERLSFQGVNKYRVVLFCLYQ